MTVTEAEVAKNRIQELREQQELKHKEDIKSEHLSRKLEVEQAHLEEFNAFNQAWDEKMRGYEAHSQEEEQKITAKQQAEFEKRIELFQSKLAEKPKPRAEILNLKRIQLNLAKQKEYLKPQTW